MKNSNGMKTRIGIIVLSVFALVVSLSWMRNDLDTLPLPPENVTELSKTVSLKFKVSNIGSNGVELALNEGGGPNSFYVQFELAANWAKGDFGLVLNNMSEQSKLKPASGQKADIGRFEKDNNGKKVQFYQFDQTLVEGDDGVTYMKMSYAGTPMPMVQSLKVDRDLVLPRHISARFVNKNNLVFKAGQYRLDNSINGFWIPVEEIMK